MAAEKKKTADAQREKKKVTLLLCKCFAFFKLQTLTLGSDVLCVLASPHNSRSFIGLRTFDACHCSLAEKPYASLCWPRAADTR